MVLIFNKTTLVCALPKKTQPSAACRARSGSIMGLNIWCPPDWLSRALGNWLGAQPTDNSHQIQRDGKHPDSAFSKWALGHTSEKYRYHQSTPQQSNSSWHSLRIEDCPKHKLGLLTFSKVAAFELLLSLYKMYRPLLDEVPKLLASLLSHSRDFGKHFLLQPCHFPASQILKLWISKWGKSSYKPALIMSVWFCYTLIYC